MLTIRHLTKTYANRTQALRGITLDAPAGMLGLLGPNGAGKSTLMKILATLLDPDTGSATLGDVDLIADRHAARHLLGYLPQDFGLYPMLTAAETIDYFAKLKGVRDGATRRRLVDDLLERVNLSDVRSRRVGGFSGGMRQRLGIAQALIGAPQLIVVDEPTAGLDPEERTRFHNLLAEFAADAVVLLSTHIVADVAGVCARLAIIDDGEIVASTTPEDAIASVTGRIWEGTVSTDSVHTLHASCDVLSTLRVPQGTRARVMSDGAPPVAGFHDVVPTLEDYYLGVMLQRQRASVS